ncbi:MAG: NADH-quinone oxidoreductase subunit NuoF [Planctomycetota bacterium]|nr:MAG: NADH-quinone oxidoreductase subunit NuoF [Planctomycetota bacterium]RLS51968.1 MAG: NADH-quinone oxidoreductase subunit NuoF [Planctomycetota bacterium]
MRLTEPVLTKRIPGCVPGISDGGTAARATVSFEQYKATGGYASLAKALDMEPAKVIELVKEAVVRGRGGAGFPAGLKWSFLPQDDGAGHRYLCINCDEAEPGTFKDRLLCDFDPHLILEGIAIACHACKLDTAYFFIRGEYHHQAKVMEKAIQEAYAGGIFGKGGLMRRPGALSVDCFLHRSAGAYICGEETGLLEAIEGKRGWPRVKPPFPAVKGLFGRPTIINNVETLAAVVPIVEKGVAWWKGIGVESSLGGMPSYGTKLMGVSGHVNRPGVFEAPLGVKLSTLVNDYCGGMRKGKRFKGAIAGGVSMGVLGTDQFDAAMDFDIGRSCNVLGLGTACPTIFDEDTDMVMVARNIARFFKNESCGQCTPCREGSGWIYKLLCRIEQGSATTADLDLLLELGMSMGLTPGTTICGLADGNNWAIRTIVGKFRGEFEKRVKPKFVPVHVSAH